MRFSVNSDELMARLTATSRVMASKTALPILDNFLFNLTDSTLELTASDGETSMATRMDVENVDGSGMIALPAKLLLDTFKVLHGRTVDFDIDMNTYAVKLSSGSWKAEYNGVDGDAYPKLTSLDASSTNTVRMQAQTLSLGISHTIFAVSTDTLRPTMMGIYLDIDAADSKITFVATDMFHLSQVKSSIVEASGNCSVILPANAAKLLKSILGKEGEDVVVSWDSKNILFELNDFTLVCRQIEGNFPNYKNAISIQWNKELVIDRNSLISAVRHIEPFAEQSNKGVKFDVRENQITVSAQSLDFGTAATEVVVCAYSGEPFEMTFKTESITNFCSYMETSDVVMKIESPYRGVVVEPLFNTSEDGEEQQNYEMLCLVMPMTTL
ncbi:MAG: DNA polymerase III subunit beta [Bacteroidales bacterium]|jgi:DNA polymerase-3 subunit beta|nr:DNA polymerase III subunit beta [Bacteroidales bacterium]